MSDKKSRRARYRRGFAATEDGNVEMDAATKGNAVLSQILGS